MRKHLIISLAVLISLLNGCDSPTLTENINTIPETEITSKGNNTLQEIISDDTAAEQENPRAEVNTGHLMLVSDGIETEVGEFSINTGELDYHPNLDGIPDKVFGVNFESQTAILGAQKTSGMCPSYYFYSLSLADGQITPLYDYINPDRCVVQWDLFGITDDKRAYHHYADWISLQRFGEEYEETPYFILNLNDFTLYDIPIDKEFYDYEHTIRVDRQSGKIILFYIIFPEQSTESYPPPGKLYCAVYSPEGELLSNQDVGMEWIYSNTSIGEMPTRTEFYATNNKVYFSYVTDWVISPKYGYHTAKEISVMQYDIETNDLKPLYSYEIFTKTYDGKNGYQIGEIIQEADNGIISLIVKGEMLDPNAVDDESSEILYRWVDLDIETGEIIKDIPIDYSELIDHSVGERFLTYLDNPNNNYYYIKYD